MPDSIFRHENRCLFHGSNFIPSPLIMTKLWNCEEQQSLFHPPNMWGVRGCGDLYETHGPTSSTLMITPSLNDATQITPQLRDSTFHHKCTGQQTWKIKRIVTGGTIYLHTDRLTDRMTNQPAYLQTILPATCRLSMPTGTPHLLWKWKVNYHFQKVCSSTPMHVFFDGVHSVHCRQPIRKAQPTKHTMFFHRYLCHTVTMSIPTWFNPHRIMIIREQVPSSTFTTN